MTGAAIRKLGLNPKDIERLLTGHAHSDHAGAHSYLQRISGAKVAVILAAWFSVSLCRAGLGEAGGAGLISTLHEVPSTARRY